MGLLAVALIAGGGWRHFAGGFSVANTQVRPTMLSTTPASGVPGQKLALTISATDISFADGSTPNFGPDITVLTSKVMNTTTLEAEIQIAPAAPVGYRRVWISLPGQKTAIDNTVNGAFQVISASAR
jgi:hypothetical protein